MLYRALIQPYFEYCSSVWDGLSAQLSDKLQKLQNRAARAITRTNYDTRSSFLRNLLGWESLDIMRKRQKAILVFKALNGLTPSYLQNLFTKAKYSYHFRNADNILSLPKPRTNFLKRSFMYSGASLWNSLPVELRTINSLGVFKKSVKRHFTSLGSSTAIM